MKHIVVASDSFKGSLSSEEVAEAVRRGIERVFPECLIHETCVADGGEGTVEALVSSLQGHIEEVWVAILWEGLYRPDMGLPAISQL